jgi:predicted RecB family nuclease
MMVELEEEYKSIATTALLKKLKLSSAPNCTELTETLLGEGHPLILDTVIEHGQLCVNCDALQRVDCKSALGNTLYEPVLFHVSNVIRREQKLSLALSGYAISKVHGIHPTRGRIIFGKNCSIMIVQLMNLNKKMLDVVHLLSRMLRAESKPTLFLNQHCNVCIFRDKCKNEAFESDSLSRLRGISKKEIERQNSKGIFTVTQYSYTYRPRKRYSKNKSSTTKHQWALNALAIRTNKIYIERMPELPIAENHIYIDIEGIPHSNFYYLLSVILRRRREKKEYTFWADKESSEDYLWLSFTDLINTLDNFIIFHYGSYDIRGLIRLCHRYNGNESLERLLKSTAYNVLSAIHGHVYFPCYTNSLKSVASCLGFKWNDATASGIDSIVRRLSWERSGCKESKNWLTRYNKDDCEALRLVTDVLYMLTQSEQVNNDRIPKTIVHTDTMKDPHTPELINNRSFFPELDILNRRSYFDYQRSRVYIRTNRNLKKRIRQAEAKKRISPPVDKIITLDPPAHCPQCKATNLIRYGLLETVVEDLKFNRKGVKRWNVKYKSSRYLCNKCRKVFTPKHFQVYSKRKHGHNLMVWSVFHNIELRQSGATVVEGLKQLFGHNSDRRFSHRLKRRAAAFYTKTYDYLKEKIRLARVVYADETPMPIREGKGYVWTFVTLEEVLYFYSDTREGGVAKQLLDGFDGVLVSDFYTAYDSLPCRQQKCLIHLIRDLNEDLFKNSFDEELKELTKRLTQVLVPIVAAIDKYGLKKRHLGKFRKPAEEFISSIAEWSLVSEIAKGYQQRITKYNDKLFEFLKHDDVAWSNNNSEHAIKRFAMLKRIIGNGSTGNGVQEYLILLSICETLRRKHLSFLRFLLSQSVDLDQFSGKKK